MYWSDSPEDANRDYQRVLAESLIRCMGIERAAHACRANGWEGVLEQVLGFSNGHD